MIISKKDYNDKEVSYVKDKIDGLDKAQEKMEERYKNKEMNLEQYKKTALNFGKQRKTLRELLFNLLKK